MSWKAAAAPTFTDRAEAHVPRFVGGGRAKTNLYAHPLPESQLASTTLGHLRDRLEPRTADGKPATADAVLFTLSCALAVVVFEVIPIVAALTARRFWRQRPFANRQATSA
jgi:hypothetical protein